MTHEDSMCGSLKDYKPELSKSRLESGSLDNGHISYDNSDEISH